MACLGDYYNEGTCADAAGEYLPEGDHHVGIESARMFRCNTGTPGVEYVLVNADMQRIKASFVMKPGCDANFKILASFVAACGITKEQMKRFDTSQLLAHQALVGKSLNVRVERTQKGKDGQMYCEVTRWWKAGAEAPPHMPRRDQKPQAGSESWDGGPNEPPLDEAFAY